jgi:hypothetical protein
VRQYALPNDRKPDAGTIDMAVLRLQSLVEGLEYMIPFRRRDAGAFVYDMNVHVFPVAFGFEANR